MRTSPILDEFDRCVCEADVFAERLNFPLQEQEAVFESALNLVLAHPEERESFIRKFSEMLHAHDVELFEYCMHELRWPEVKTHLEAEICAAASEPRDMRTEFFLKGVLRAFGDDWSGRGFYKRFGG